MLQSLNICAAINMTLWSVAGVTIMVPNSLAEEVIRPESPIQLTFLISAVGSSITMTWLASRYFNRSDRRISILEKEHRMKVAFLYRVAKHLKLEDSIFDELDDKGKN